VTPQVSILIPCFNAGRWIGRAIESALDQRGVTVETIVVDDGSTDDGVAAIAAFGDRVRLIRQANAGGNVARRRLVAEARAEWLQFLDADDYLKPDKIARQLARVGPDVDVVYSPVLVETWRDGRIESTTPTVIDEPRDAWRLLALWRLPQTGGPLWRKRALIEAGDWKVDQPCCQEHELYGRMLAGGAKFEYDPEPLAVYRHWSEATVCRKDPFLVVRKRIEVIDRAERDLLRIGAMTPIRRDAIARGRLECARVLYVADPDEAIETARRTLKGHPYYRLPAESPFPISYRLAYHSLGFAAAEKIASLVRRRRFWPISSAAVDRSSLLAPESTPAKSDFEVVPER
jgi:glycosyltransferase involved in cell wall biosynthesis